MKALSEVQHRLVVWMEESEQWIMSYAQAAAYLDVSCDRLYSEVRGLYLRRLVKPLGMDHFLLVHLSDPAMQLVLDPLVVGSYLIAPYYFSYGTALRYHGLLDGDDSTVYVVSRSGKKHVELLGVEYRFVCVDERKFFGFERVKVDGLMVSMADRVKAVVDSLEKYWLVGDIAVVVGLVRDNLEVIDVDRLVEYVVLMGNSRLIQMTGYLLDRLGVAFDDALLLSYSRQVLYYFDQYACYDVKSRRDEKWNLMVNVPDSLFG